MVKEDKLVKRIKSKPKDFTWKELTTLMKKKGYEPLEGSGSRVKFVNEDKRVMSIHKPHPSNELKPYQIKDIVDFLGL